MAIKRAEVEMFGAWKDASHLAMKLMCVAARALLDCTQYNV